MQKAEKVEIVLFPCWIDDHGRCCCDCKNRLTDMSHPSTNKRPVSVRRGWICFPPEFEGKAFSGWTEHGLCEMWEKK